MKKWYTPTVSERATQGLICDESTGRSVAVAYDKADACLIASAPELLAALELILDEDDGPIVGDGFDNPWVAEARAVIAKAKGA